MKVSINEIKEKLDRISDVWFHFAWEFKSGRSQVNFNDDTKTTYFGDILTYFGDTFDSLVKRNESRTYPDHALFFIGIMQIIYVHQDLVGELMYAFKLNKDVLAHDANRNINREIRNELIGHPIRRAKNDSNNLISTVIFGNKLGHDKIHYVKYSKENKFVGVEIGHFLNDILDRHFLFLNASFDSILKKTKTILLRFKKQTLGLQKTINDPRIDFIKKLNLIDQLFESIWKENLLYKKALLIEIYTRKEEHIRYQFAFDMFLKELNSSISHRINWVDEILVPKGTQNNVEEFVPPKINIVISGKPPKRGKAKVKRDYGYELGKLFGKHPIWGVSYFKQEFSKNKPILEELNNMTINEVSDLEYYCSYEYVRFLILRKKGY